MRLRLTAWFTLGVVLLSAVGVGLTYVVLHRQLVGRVDADLARELRAFSTAVSSAGTVSEVERLTEEYLSGPSATGLLSSGLTLALVTDAGRVVASPAQTRLEELIPPGIPGDGTSPAVVTAESDGEPYRLAVSPVLADGGPVAVVVVAAPLGPTQDTLSRILLVLVAAAAAGVVAMGLGSWLLADRALEPVRRITRTAGSITQRDLSERISYSGPHDDVEELADTMNAMLDRLQSAFEAQERFILDVSHELRTPLTIAKGHLQVLDRQAEPDPEVVRCEHRLVIEELDRMNRLVADLLLIARSVRTDFLRREIVDLDRLLEVLARQGPALAEREWRVEAWPGGAVPADQDRLVQSLLNLMRNAVEHSDRGDMIALGGRRSSEWVHLWVRDEGEGMSPDVRDRVFDRFYRAPAAGNGDDRQDGGLGLGLAIVRAIVVAHGGTLTVESEVGEGSTFTMALPARMRGTEGGTEDGGATESGGRAGG